MAATVRGFHGARSVVQAVERQTNDAEAKWRALEKSKKGSVKDKASSGSHRLSVGRQDGYARPLRYGCVCEGERVKEGGIGIDQGAENEKLTIKMPVSWGNGKGC